MLTDGHCHPTDDPSSLDSIANLECRMALMSTRFDDLDIVAEQAKKHPDKIVPAFGLHPWYSHLLKTEPKFSKTEHYQAILDPAPEANDPVLTALPEPVLLETHISRLQDLLTEFPNALIGEVGLDKAFRLKVNDEITHFKVKLDHQRLVLRYQLQLAADLHRSVSLHGVQAPQALFDDVYEFASSDQPRLGNVCLHSYGGSAEFYRDHWRKKLNVKVFISVAILINGKMQPQKLGRLLKGALPDLVLSESDYNSAGETQVDLVRQSANLFAQHFSQDTESMIEQLEKNFNEFVNT